MWISGPKIVTIRTLSQVLSTRTAVHLAITATTMTTQCNKASQNTAYKNNTTSHYSITPQDSQAQYRTTQNHTTPHMTLHYVMTIHNTKQCNTLRYNTAKQSITPHPTPHDSNTTKHIGTQHKTSHKKHNTN